MSNEKKNSYAPLWILIAVCAFPYVLGTLYFNFKDELPDMKTNNYGHLIQPVRVLPEMNFQLVDGGIKTNSDYGKKWLMIYVIDKPCAERCRQDLYFMRQLRKAMAKDRYRINRLLLLENENLMDEALKNIVQDHPGLDIALLSENEKQGFYSTAALDSGNIYEKIMLIDPFGNYMMEFPRQPDPKKMLDDIKRLLSVSRVG